MRILEITPLSVNTLVKKISLSSNLVYREINLTKHRSKQANMSPTSTHTKRKLSKILVTMLHLGAELTSL